MIAVRIVPRWMLPHPRIFDVKTSGNRAKSMDMDSSLEMEPCRTELEEVTWPKSGS